jgi:hypothetical protein
MVKRRIKVKGIRKDELDTNMYALVLWTLAKEAVADKRRREAEAKKTARQEKQR